MAMPLAGVVGVKRVLKGRERVVAVSSEEVARVRVMMPRWADVGKVRVRMRGRREMICMICRWMGTTRIEV